MFASRSNGWVYVALLTIGMFAEAQNAHAQSQVRHAAQSVSKVSLEAEELDESSGVCVSHRGTVIWSHNDSGGEPRLFGFDLKGERVSELKIEGAKAIDWEDMCSFERNGKQYFAIGDVGDNLARRDLVQIYVCEIPKVLKREQEVKVVATLKVRYESGSVNCEALCYDSVRDAFLLLSKENLRCRFFEVPIQDLRGKNTVVAKLKKSIWMPMVTGADISRDGKSLAIATYGAGALFRRGEQESTWRKAENENAGLIELPIRRQGESICFDLSGEGLFLTSEFSPTPLFKIKCPTPAK